MTKLIKKIPKKRLIFIDDKYMFRIKKPYWLPDDMWDIVKEYAGIYNLKINYNKIQRIGVKPLLNFYKQEFKFRITNYNSNTKKVKKMMFKSFIDKGMDKDKWLKLQALTVRTVNGWDDTLHIGHKFIESNKSYQNRYGDDVNDESNYIRFTIERITKCFVFGVDMRGNKFKGKKKWDDVANSEYIKITDISPKFCNNESCYHLRLFADNNFVGWYKYRDGDFSIDNNGWIIYGNYY